MKNVKKILTVVFSVSFCLFCLISPTDAKAAAAVGINRCISIIIPSLYAMMTASVLLMKCGVLSSAGRYISPITRRIFGMNGEMGVIFLFSLFSGYPVGAKMIYSMYTEGRLPKKTAELMAGLCFGAGTAFIFGCAASTAEIGRLILASNFIAEILLAIILSFYFRKNPIEEKKCKSDISANILTDSVTSAGKSLGDMCLCVVVFSVFTKIVKKTGIIHRFAEAFRFSDSIFSAVLDITAISETSADIPITAALISFGGVCVFFQISAIFHGKLSIMPLVMIRTVTAIISYCICRILQPFFISEEVTAVFASSGCMYREVSPIPSIMLILMTGIVIAESAKIKDMSKADSQ